MPLSRKGLQVAAVALTGSMAFAGWAGPAQAADLDIGSTIAAAAAAGSGVPMEPATPTPAAPAAALAPAEPITTAAVTPAATPKGESEPRRPEAPPSPSPMESPAVTVMAQPPQAAAAAPIPSLPPTPQQQAQSTTAATADWSTTVTPAAPGPMAMTESPAPTAAPVAPATQPIAEPTPTPMAAPTPAPPSADMPLPHYPAPPKNSLAAEKPETALKIARAAAAGGDFAAAARIYRQLAGRSDASPEVLSGLGDALYAQNALDEATQAYAGALHDKPAMVGANVGMGKALIALSRPAEAKGYFERALASATDNRSALNGLAVVNDTMGDHNAAQEIYRRALAQYPDDPSLRSNYALSLQLSGQAAPQATPAAARPSPEHARQTTGAPPPGTATMAPIPY